MGGGGDAAPGTTAPLAPLTLTAANEVPVTGAAFETAAGVLGFGTLLPVGVQTSTEAPKQRVLSRLTATVVQKIAEQKAAPARVTGVVTVEFCQPGNPHSGTVQIDTLGGTTAATATFSNCDFGTGEVINGTMSLSGMTETASSAAGRVSLNITISGTSFDPVTVTGGFAFEFSGIGATVAVFVMSGTHLTVTQGLHSETLSNFDFRSSYDTRARIYTDTANFTLSSTGIGGSFTVATMTPFVTDAAARYPHSGVVRISGAGLSCLRVTVLGNETAATNSQVRIERSVDGCSTYAAPRHVTWAEL